MLTQIILIIFAFIVSLLLLYFSVKLFNRKVKFLSSLKVMLFYDLAVFLFLLIYSSPSKCIKFPLSLIVLIGFFLASFVIFFLIAKGFKLLLSWKKALAVFFIVMIVANIISYGLTQIVGLRTLGKGEISPAMSFSDILNPSINVRAINALSESVGWSYLSDYLFKSLACGVINSPDNKYRLPFRNEKYGLEFKYPREWGDVKLESRETTNLYLFTASSKEIEKFWYHQPTGKLIFIKKGASCVLYGGTPFYEQSLFIINQGGEKNIILQPPKTLTGDYCREISAVNLSPNGAYAYILIHGWEDIEPLIINVETEANIIKNYDIWFDKDTLYNNIVWSPDNDLLAIKSEIFLVGGRKGDNGVFLSAYNNPEKLRPIFLLNNGETLDDYKVYNLHFINNHTLAFVVGKEGYNYAKNQSYLKEIRTRYEYDIETKKLKEVLSEKTFEDSSGFMVKYADNWVARHETGGGVTFTNHDVPCDIYIYPTLAERKANSDCGNFFLSSYSLELGYTSSRTDFNVDNTPVFQIKKFDQSIFKRGGKFGYFEGPWYVFGPGKKNSQTGFPVCFEAGVSGNMQPSGNLQPNMAQAEDNTNCAKILNQILSTFRFIE